MPYPDALGRTDEGDGLMDRSELMAHQDNCLANIIAGRSLPTAELQNLPPWRAVMMARVADKAGVPLEQGTLTQLIQEAARVTGAGDLGNWWEPEEAVSV